MIYSSCAWCRTAQGAPPRGSRRRGRASAQTKWRGRRRAGRSTRRLARSPPYARTAARTKSECGTWTCLRPVAAQAPMGADAGLLSVAWELNSWQCMVAVTCRPLYLDACSITMHDETDVWSADCARQNEFMVITHKKRCIRVACTFATTVHEDCGVVTFGVRCVLLACGNRCLGAAPGVDQGLEQRRHALRDAQYDTAIAARYSNCCRAARDNSVARPYRVPHKRVKHRPSPACSAMTNASLFTAPAQSLLTYQGCRRIRHLEQRCVHGGNARG
jgi:hypothetical protein